MRKYKTDKEGYRYTTDKEGNKCISLDCDVIERVTGCESVTNFPDKQPKKAVNCLYTKYYGKRWNDNLECVAIVEYRNISVSPIQYELSSIWFLDEYWLLSDKERKEICIEIFKKINNGYYSAMCSNKTFKNRFFMKPPN